jgi:hypothetical protein
MAPRLLNFNKDSLSRPALSLTDTVCRMSQVCKDAALSDWQLYLVDWGYNTPAERARAAANPRITVIDVAEFAALMA